MDKGGAEGDGNVSVVQERSFPLSEMLTECLQIVFDVYNSSNWVSDEGRFRKRRSGDYSEQLGERTEQEHVDP